VLAGLFALLTATKASACPDCPFPMKVGANEWIMPNSSVLLAINETKDITSGDYRISVILQDRETGTILAEGIAWRKPGQRQLQIMLWDTNSRRISGVIYWINFKKSVIKAKFSCLDENCSIARRL